MNGCTEKTTVSRTTARTHWVLPHKEAPLVWTGRTNFWGAMKALRPAHPAVLIGSSKLQTFVTCCNWPGDDHQAAYSL